MSSKNEKKINDIVISNDDQYLFAQGTHYEIYKKLGAHKAVRRKKEGVYFATWAPNAKEVFVVGSFNDWKETHKMDLLGTGGIHGLFIQEIGEGELYKFLIITKNNEKIYKADPYANYAEPRPQTASIVTDLTTFKWSDERWLVARRKKDMQKEPIAIYECHLGSWMKHEDESEEGFYTYIEFADKIVKYLKEMNYTHIELMGIAEYPYDGSWGYQVTGYYAPTSRYGKPTDFMYLVNQLHKNGIGVILDWVPAHFATDDHSLTKFDGECIYEHSDPILGEHPQWGTKIFNYEKKEVQNFLIANVLFWMNEFHIDGVRVDAVASMLYLDYGREDSEWYPNKYGDNKNLVVEDFLKHLNSVVKGKESGFITIAEESTTWPGVTNKQEDGGLGFDFKWNMGWMHDFCEYMKLDPIFRKNNHHALTFAMTYNESERYVLPLSHDEVVHLKCSMLTKMPGYEIDKFANLRVGYTYMMTHSGKKLLFMGQEFGQEREWSESRELDWFLLENKYNKGLQLFVKELLGIYRKYPCMYEMDQNWDGFEWLNANDADRSIYAFMRKAPKRKHKVVVILNMTPMYRENYRVGVASKHKLKLILNSDEERFGGNGNSLPNEIIPELIFADYKEYSIGFDLPPYTAAVFVSEG